MKRWKRMLCAMVLCGVWRMCFSDTLADASDRFFPETYEEEDGNVSFACRLFVPEDCNAKRLKKLAVKGLYYSDYDKCLENLSNGKTVLEDTIYPADEEYSIPEWHYTVFEDNTIMCNGNSTSFVTENSTHYSTVFYHLANYALGDGGAGLEFSSVEEHKEKLLSLLKWIGIEADLELYSYGLKAEEARQWEEHLGQDGGQQENLYKQDWSGKDDAYIMYGYQYIQDLPVYHELMFLGGQMKYVNPYNASLQAIYTQNGLELLYAHYLYEFEILDEYVQLQEFSRIAQTVSEKLNNTLANERYEVKEAALMEMVKHSQNQDYEALPVWYVEISAVDGTIAMLVDAATAEEVYVA